ncbi:hypothetical protein ABPG77_007221 [Micractinium sp. CCAP 211/92]
MSLAALVGGGGPAPAPSRRRTSSSEPEPLVHELTRLRNELKVKDAAIEERTLEVATLQRQVRAAEDGIQHAERELATAKDRLLTAETDAQSLRKQLQAAQAERDALRRESEGMERGASRAREREFEAMSAKVAAAEAAQIRAKDLESAMTALRSQLAAAREELATLQRQQAAAQREAEDARQQAAKAERELASTSDYLAGVMSELAATQDSLQSARRDSKLLQEQLVAATASGRAPAAAPAPSPAPSQDAATASAHAALQQALQQLSLRTKEVQELRQQLDAAQAAAAAAAAAAPAPSAEAVPEPAAAAVAPGEAASVDASVAAAAVDAAAASTGSGPATPVTASPGEANSSSQGAFDSAAPPGAAGVGSPRAAAASAAATPTAAAPLSVAVPGSSAVGHAAAAGAAAGAAAAPGAAASPLPAAWAPSPDMPDDLPEAHRLIQHLRQQVATLRCHLAEAAAAHTDSEEESDDEGQPRRAGGTPGSGATPRAAGPLTPAEQAAEERRRNMERGTMGSLWFGSQGGDRHYATATALTKEALAEVIDKLLESREQQAVRARAKGKSMKRPGMPGLDTSPGSPGGGGGEAGQEGAGSEGRDDTALWEEATAMLRGELIRLGQEAAQKMEENERLRNEVGELKTARLSAEATAARLEEMNALSIRVASLKLELAALRSEQDIREDELLAQIAMLQATLAKKKRRKGPGRMFKKAAEAIRQGLSPDKELGAPLPPQQQAGTPSGGAVKTWGSLKSKFSGLGRSSSSREAEAAAGLSPRR